MIPVTVSFFTKQPGSSRKGVLNAFLYSFFIFLVYVLISVPFYFLKASNTDILNNISTNPTLNIFFGLVFLVFALSFFGLFEITLPSRLTNKVGSKSGLGSVSGIFFMALTLAIVSFSCTGPILGTLLVGAFGKEGNPFQLSVAMAGFGLTLGLPFGIFAMFPKWLAKLPRSGSWMNTVKIVFGFVELALMVKFFSNADLVMHWGLLKREVFIGIWVLLGLATSLFLFGILKFKYDPPPPKLSKLRIFFALVFLGFTLYCVPGLTNTSYANLKLISGFPPPLSYSIYEQEKSKGIHLVNNYEEALELSRKLNKPVLIDFTGWACVNCRNMEENVWVEPEIKSLIDGNFILASLYVDDRGVLPVAEQHIFTTSDSSKKEIKTIGDKFGTLQAENFRAVSQPWYAIIDGNEKLMNLPVGYTPNVSKYAAWLNCGLDAFNKNKGQAAK
jgi:thiol:disulfide interchange protein DsbD